MEICINGKEVLKIIFEFKFDLVLLDIMMFEMWGDELCFVIKNNILMFYIFVILLIVLNDEKNIVEGLEIGVDKYLIKFFNIGILKVFIVNILINCVLFCSKYVEMELYNDSIFINYSNILD